MQVIQIVWAEKQSIVIPVKVLDTKVEAEAELKKLINVDSKGIDEVEV